MTEKETLLLLKMICSAYPMVEMTNERIDLWVEDMQEVPFEPALNKFKQHRRTEKYPPSIADFYEVYEVQKKEQQADREEWLRLNGSAEPMKALGD